jgi:hypothetical protein
VNGRTIRTTAEHPFWMRGRGWVAAHQLRAGDELRTHDGRWLKVDGFEGPKPSEPVYNMCVSGYHTYFIGHQIWGFAVWSHNITAPCGGERGAAPRTVKGRLNAAQLPTSGKIRYVPPKNYSPGQPLPRGPNGGYLDRFGNEWVKGPSRTAGQPFEWDVQLGRNATPGMGKLSRDGKHVNISLDGEWTHF